MGSSIRNGLSEWKIMEQWVKTIQGRFVCLIMTLTGWYMVVLDCYYSCSFRDFLSRGDYGHTTVVWVVLLSLYTEIVPLVARVTDAPEPLFEVHIK